LDIFVWWADNGAKWVNLRIATYGVNLWFDSNAYDFFRDWTDIKNNRNQTNYV
jgi:hypothetical protein